MQLWGWSGPIRTTVDSTGAIREVKAHSGHSSGTWVSVRSLTEQRRLSNSVACVILALQGALFATFTNSTGSYLGALFA